MSGHSGMAQQGIEREKRKIWKGRRVWKKKNCIAFEEYGNKGIILQGGDPKFTKMENNFGV